MSSQTGTWTADHTPRKLNRTLLKSTIVAALGGLLFGFDTAVIAGTTRALTTTYGLPRELWTIAVLPASCARGEDVLDSI